MAMSSNTTNEMMKACIIKVRVMATDGGIGDRVERYRLDNRSSVGLILSWGIASVSKISMDLVESVLKCHPSHDMAEISAVARIASSGGRRGGTGVTGCDKSACRAYGGRRSRSSSGRAFLLLARFRLGGRGRSLGSISGRRRRLGGRTRG